MFGHSSWLTQVSIIIRGCSIGGFVLALRRGIFGLFVGVASFGISLWGCFAIFSHMV